MAKKVKFYHLWETKHFVAAIVGILLLALIVLFRPIVNYYKYSKYDEQTIGKLLSMKAKTTMTQGFDGGSTVVNHYKVNFTYRVNGQNFTGIDKVNGLEVNGYKLKNILKSATKAIVVRYNSKNPAKAVVDMR